MQNLKLTFGVLCIGFLLLMSCNDATLIGSDVLEEDQFNIQSSEDIEILARTVYAEPVRTFDEVINFQLINYLIGKVDDPIFGTYQSSVFTEFTLNGLSPDFTGKTLDSAIILLPFDSLTMGYGEDIIGQSFDVELHQLATRFGDAEFHLSDETIEVSEFLGTVQMVPSTDLVTIDVPNSDTTQQLPPHFRIPLPTALAEKIFNAPSTAFDSTAAFQDFFPGIEFRPAGGPNAIFGVQLRGNLTAQMQFFFSDTLERVYNFPVSNTSTKMTTFDHDFTGSIVDEFVQKGNEGGDSLLFVQSLEGTDIELTFPNLEDLGDIVVNKAELIFEVDSIPGDDFDLYSPTPQMMVNQVEDDGDLVLIEDLGILIARYGEVDGFAIFGGSPDDDRIYSLNISGHFQRMIDGEATNVLRITPLNGDRTFFNLNRGNEASRVVIKGPENTQGRMKLVLNYTKI